MSPCVLYCVGGQRQQVRGRCGRFQFSQIWSDVIRCGNQSYRRYKGGHFAPTNGREEIRGYLSVNSPELIFDLVNAKPGTFG